MASIVSAGTTSGTALNMSGDTSGVLQLASNNGTTAVTIDTSQNVGIGTTSPSYRVDAVGTGTASTGIIRTSSNLTNSSTKYGYYTVGHYTNANAPFGFIQGESNSTDNNVHIGGGAGEVNAATRIDFYTAANNTTTNGTERMRIDSGGRLLVGCTTEPNSSVNGFKADVSYTIIASSGQTPFYVNRNTNTGTIIELRYNNSSVGTISTNGSNTAYNTSSDYRLKENISPMTGALATVAQLKPVTYKWKFTGKESQGFIAHEIAEVVPDCVTGEKDAVDADGKPVYQGIDVSFLVATLTAAIQELSAKNDALTARVVALEAK